MLREDADSSYSSEDEENLFAVRHRRDPLNDSSSSPSKDRKRSGAKLSSSYKDRKTSGEVYNSANTDRMVSWESRKSSSTTEHAPRHATRHAQSLSVGSVVEDMPVGYHEDAYDSAGSSHQSVRESLNVSPHLSPRGSRSNSPPHKEVFKGMTQTFASINQGRDCIVVDTHSPMCLSSSRWCVMSVCWP